MKKNLIFGLILAAFLCSASFLSSANLAGKRIYINPGHGSWTSATEYNDRPCPTIPYPNLPNMQQPDTLGFYESNTNLWKCLYLGKKLEEAGATVFYSRKANGPWPYEMKDGYYPDFDTLSYKSLSEYKKYNRSLTEISAEVEANNIDYFISVHSNAGSSQTANYPLFIYRGPNDYKNANTNKGYEYVEGSYEKAAAAWDHCNEIMLSGINPSTDYKTTKYITGDISFYGSAYESYNTSSWRTYYGYLGALKHGASGFLVEGYFHTYEPARHRALNPDYCAMEGLAYYRGIIDYYNADKESKGYIMGTVKDLYKQIDHPLFTYQKGTNDQWIPCNGATVTLYKAGVAVQTYKVDTLYNGIFVFKDLEPGNDYSLDATCPGYAPLDNKYKATFTVDANKTTYKMIFLEQAEQPQAIPSIFAMEQPYSDKNINALLINKTIRRTLYADNTIYILAVNSNKQPTLLAVDANTRSVALLPTSLCSVASSNGYPLSDITLTEDGVLIGCNMENTTSTPKNQWKLYQWTKNATGWQQSLWLTHAQTITSGNWESAMTGASIAYKGTLKRGTLVTTAASTYTPNKTRLVIYDIAGNKIHKVWYNKIASDENTSSMETFGTNLQLQVSPFETSDFILSSSKKNAFDWTINTTNMGVITTNATMSTHTYNAAFFTYANKPCMAIANKDTYGYNTGVQFYDISQVTNKTIYPQLIKTINTSLKSANATYLSCLANAYNKDITLYLIRDNSLTKFTTTNVEQPAIPHINAYDLRAVNNKTYITFSFTANSDAESAAIIFYNKQNGKQLARKSIIVAQGKNTLNIPINELPGAQNEELTWGLELQGLTINTWQKIYGTTSHNFVRPFITINNTPESDYFQHIYLCERAAANSTNNGLHLFTPDYNIVNTTPYKGGRSTIGSPYRCFVDDQGYIWMSDGSDTYSGIFIANPAAPQGTHSAFFQGTRSSSGLISNAGNAVGSSCTGLSIYGTGAQTKLIAFNEDAGTGLKENSLAIYNIGKAEGTYTHSWSTKPSSNITLSSIASYDVYPLGCSHGIWVAQVCANGENKSSKAALQFYDWSGNRKMTSADAKYSQHINGSQSAACALSRDESTLYFVDASGNILVWDIQWSNDHTPTLTLRDTYATGLSSIRQMHIDYAGNIICSGETEDVTVLAMPTQSNQTLIPAPTSQSISKGHIRVQSIELSAKKIELQVGATHTLSATLLPSNASNPTILWRSANPKIATVDHGFITGSYRGTTYVYAIAEDDNTVVDSCQVNVFAYMADAEATRIWAYNLHRHTTGSKHAFTFSSTADATEAYLLITDQQNNLIEKHPIASVKKGNNTFVLSALPNNMHNWAIELHADRIEKTVEITKNEDKYYYWLSQGVAVNNNPDLDHFGHIYVSNPRKGDGGISQHSQTQTTGIYVYDPLLNLENYALGYKPSNVTLANSWDAIHRIAVNPIDGSLAFTQWNANPYAVYAMNPYDMNGQATTLFQEDSYQPTSLCYDQEGNLYILSYIKGGTYAILKVEDQQFTTIFSAAQSEWIADGRNAIASDGRGGFYVISWLNNTNGKLVHIGSNGIDLEISSSDHIANMPTNFSRGHLAYDFKRDILAIGGAGKVTLYQATYNTGKPVLTKWTETPSIGSETSNIDGLAFDYAGDLYVTSGFTERFYKFALPTNDNSCITPAKKAIILDETADNTAIINAHANHTLNAELHRTWQTNTYNLVCLPFSIENIQHTPLQDAEVYAFTNAAVSSVNGQSMLDLQFKQQNFIEAGIPYVILPKSDIPSITLFNNITLSNQPAQSITCGFITLTGVLAPCHIESNKLLMTFKDNQPAWTKTFDLNGMNGYFETSNMLLQNMPIIISTQDPNPTATDNIPTIENGTYKMIHNGVIYIIHNGQVYNLQGTLLK